MHLILESISFQASIKVIATLLQNINIGCLHNKLTLVQHISSKLFFTRQFNMENNLEKQVKTCFPYNSLACLALLYYIAALVITRGGIIRSSYTR